MKGRVIRIALAGSLLAMLPSAAGAGDVEEPFHPVGYVDLTTGSMVDVDFNIGTESAVTAFVPEFTLQLGLGNIAVGLDWGFAVVDVEGTDTGFYSGNFVLNFKGKHCIEGTWMTCLGVELEVAIAPFAADEEETEEVLAAFGGMFVHMVRWNRYAGEAMAIDPLLAVSATNGTFFLQLSLGPSVFIPFTESKSQLIDREVEAALLWEFVLGARIADLIGVLMGLTGHSTLTFPNNETYFAMHFDFRVSLDMVSPHFKLMIPLEDKYNDVFDVIITLGLTADF